jgi:hypothetical protein
MQMMCKWETLKCNHGSIREMLFGCDEDAIGENLSFSGASKINLEFS